MSKIAELPFRVSLEMIVTVEDCETKSWGATGETLAANQRLLQAVLRNPSLLQLVVRYNLTSELTEAFGWDQAAATAIFVDYQELDRRLAELVRACLPAADQDILIDGNDDERLSDDAFTFGSAFTVTLTNLQVQPVIDTKPSENEPA